MNRIRWELNVETHGDDFKICNDYFAFYARLFIIEHPDQGDLFTIKRMKPGNEPPPEWFHAILANDNNSQ